MLEIYKLLDWNVSLDQQQLGIKLAIETRQIAPFIQPLTNDYGKNIWDNCALIISSKSDNELKEYLELLFNWLQDLTWPGALTILNRIQKFEKDDAFYLVLNACIDKAILNNDVTWKENLSNIESKC